MRHRSPPSAEAFDEAVDRAVARAFDDRATSQRAGVVALAFCLGSAAALLALRGAKARALPAGPADGAPLMRAPLQVVAPVDIKRYAGRWYEQARLPNRYQRACAGAVSADYTPLADGTLEVRNRCVRDDGQVTEAIGQARVVPVAGLPGAGRLEVRFAPDWLSWLPLVWGDYWILKLDRDYQLALVGTPDRESLWVLSRVAQLDEAALEGELEFARALGFDVDRAVRTAARPAGE